MKYWKKLYRIPASKGEKRYWKPQIWLRKRSIWQLQGINPEMPIEFHEEIQQPNRIILTFRNTEIKRSKG